MVLYSIVRYSTALYGILLYCRVFHLYSIVVYPILSHCCSACRHTHTHTSGADVAIGSVMNVVTIPSSSLGLRSKEKKDETLIVVCNRWFW